MGDRYRRLIKRRKLKRMDTERRTRSTRNHVRQLDPLGYTVTLTAAS